MATSMMINARGEYRQESNAGIIKGKLNNLLLENHERLLKDDGFQRTISLLADGEISPLIELKDGRKVKIQKRGEEYVLYPKKDVLVIPDVILNEPISSKEKQDLEAGKVIALKNQKNTIYLNIDKETNSLIIRSDKDFKIPQIVGANKHFDYPGYTLNELDKILLANGKSTDAKLICGDKGFFLAEIALSKDNKGIVFSNIQSMSEEQAKKYKATLTENIKEEKTNKTEATANKREALKDESKSVVSNRTPLDISFEQAIKENDFIKVNQLSKDGYMPSKELVDTISPSLSETQRIAIAKIFTVETENKASVINTTREEVKGSDKQDRMDKQNTIQTTRQIVNTLFSGDM